MVQYMTIYENRPTKIEFFWCQGIFFINFDFKNGCKMNYRIITKNHVGDQEIGFITKSISKLNGRAMAMPTAWKVI